jgi:hypothetical protein
MLASLDDLNNSNRGHWIYNDVFTWGNGIKSKIHYKFSLLTFPKANSAKLKGEDVHMVSLKSHPHLIPIVVRELRGNGPTFIAVGELHSAAIADAGRDVYMWGQGDKGQLGRGDLESQSIPRLVIALRDKRVQKLSCGQEHTLALTATGTLYTFGRKI